MPDVNLNSYLKQLSTPTLTNEEIKEVISACLIERLYINASEILLQAGRTLMVELQDFTFKERKSASNFVMLIIESN